MTSVLICLISALVLASFLEVHAVEIGFYPRLSAASGIEEDEPGTAELVNIYQEANLKNPYYKNIIDSAARQEFKSTLAKADFEVFLQTSNSFCLGLSRVAISEGNSPLRFPILLNRSAVCEFLRKEAHKDLLVIRLSKFMIGPGKTEKELAELQPFFESIGYRRIIVLGSASSGVFVLADRKFGSGDLNGSANREVSRDRRIRISHDINSIDIGVPGHTFTPGELEEFFRRDPHKELLVVQLGKPLHSAQERVRDVVTRFGYRRVIYKSDPALCDLPVDD